MLLVDFMNGGKSVDGNKQDSEVSVLKWFGSKLFFGGNYMYRQFNIQQFYILPTQCICVFCVDLRTNSDYFPIQH